MLTKKQFDILVALERDGKQTQRSLAAAAGISLGAANKTLTELIDLGFVADGKVTDQGLEALEPYRVKRAVFIAAGFGSRLVPITLNTPKPLVRVKGKRIIESLLDAVVAETMVATHMDVHCTEDRRIDLYAGDALIRSMIWSTCCDTVLVYDTDESHWVVSIEGAEEGGCIILSNQLAKRLDAFID